MVFSYITLWNILILIFIRPVLYLQNGEDNECLWQLNLKKNQKNLEFQSSHNSATEISAV